MRLRRGPGAQGYYESAQRQLAAGDPAAALVLADQAVEADPQHVLGHFARGVAQSELERYEDALATFRALLVLDPTATYCHYRIAFQLLQLGRTDEALAAAETATSVAPSDFAPHVLRGAILADSGRLDEAVDALTRAAELSPDTQIRYDRALVLRALSRFDEAVADLDQVIAARPDAALAQIEQGITLALAGRPDDALIVLPTATGNPAGLVWAAAIHWHQGELEAARSLFTQAGYGFDHATWQATARRNPALRAVTACALGQLDREAAAVAELGPPGLGDRVVLGGLCRLLSEPELPGIDRLAPQLLRD